MAQGKRKKSLGEIAAEQRAKRQERARDAAASQRATTRQQGRESRAIQEEKKKERKVGQRLLADEERSKAQKSKLATAPRIGTRSWEVPKTTATKQRLKKATKAIKKNIRASKLRGTGTWKKK